LPKDLGGALAALRASEVFAKNFGAAFVDYYAHIKEAELARFKAEATGGENEITAWEQNEYFDLF
jgi:glutamine synthetase